MTQEELQSVTNAVLTSIHNKSKTIDQLEVATSILDSDCIELSGGRRATIAMLKQKFGSNSGNGSVGLDVNSLASYLSEHNYATQNWVTGKNYVTQISLTETLKNYVTSNSLTETLKDYLTKDLAASTYVKKVGDVMTGRLTVPSLKIGDAIFTWDSEHDGVKISKGFYSETYISAKDIAPDLVGEGGGSSGGLDINELENYLTTHEYTTAQGVLEIIREDNTFATKTYVDNKFSQINIGGESQPQELEWNYDDNSLGITDGNSVFIEYANSAGNAETATTADSADRLSSSVRLWGNTFNGTSDVNGGLTPGADSTYNLGTSARQWANVYAKILTASQSIKLGNGIITWESSHGGYFSFSGGIFSNKFLTAKGLAPDIDEDGVVNIFGDLNRVHSIGLNENGDTFHSGVLITPTQMLLQDLTQNFTIEGRDHGVIMEFSPSNATVGIGDYALSGYKLNVGGGVRAQRLCLGTSTTDDNNMYKLYVDGSSYFENVKINGQFNVTSRNKVSRLNADQVDGYDADSLFDSISIVGRLLSITIGGKTLQATLPSSGGMIEVPVN